MLERSMNKRGAQMQALPISEQSLNPQRWPFASPLNKAQAEDRIKELTPWSVKLTTASYDA